MKFQVGVFAQLGEKWDGDEDKIVEEVKYKVHDWCTKAGVEYYKGEGEVLVELHEFDFEGAVKREEIVTGMVEGLRNKQQTIQAEAQAQVTQLDAQINKLLALAAPPSPTGWDVV